MNVIEVVSDVLTRLGAPYALIGGRAVGIRGFPRMTLDYDFLTTDSRVLDSAAWASAVDRHGATIDARKGEFDDPIAGVVHVTFPDGIEADVLLAKWKWELAVIQRSEVLEIVGTRVPVPVTSDLILLKLAAGGPIDLQDIVELVATDRERWISEVDEKVADVRPDVTELWKKLRDSL